MPTYVYKFIDSGETIEVQQSFSDDSLTEFAHPDSGEVLPVKKVFQPVGVTFKGTGFFKNDNRGKTSSSTAPGSTDSSSSKPDSSSSSSDSSSSKSESSSSSSESKSSNSTSDSSSSKSSSSKSSSSSSSD